MAKWVESRQAAQRGFAENLGQAGALKEARLGRRERAFGNLTDAIGGLADTVQAKKTREDEQAARLEEIGATGEQTRETVTLSEEERRKTMYGEEARLYEEFKTGEQKDIMNTAAKIERKAMELEAQLSETQAAIDQMYAQARQGQADEAALERLQAQLDAERLAAEELRRWQEEVEFEHERQMSKDSLAAQTDYLRLQAELRDDADSEDYDQAETFLKMMKMSAITSGQYDVNAPDGLSPTFDFNDADAVDRLRSVFSSHAAAFGPERQAQLEELFDSTVNSRATAPSVAEGTPGDIFTSHEMFAKDVARKNAPGATRRTQVTEGEQDLYKRVMEASRNMVSGGVDANNPEIRRAAQELSGAYSIIEGVGETTEEDRLTIDNLLARIQRLLASGTPEFSGH